MSDNPRRILAVEDNPALASVIRFNLRKAGFDVTCARNGHEAWQLLGRQQFDFLVTDHQMPEMTGYELCERMRGDARLCQLPIIMLTAKGLELELSKLKDKLGVLQILPKPFSPSELVQRIERYFAMEASSN